MIFVGFLASLFDGGSHGAHESKDPHPVALSHIPDGGPSGGFENLLKVARLVVNSECRRTLFPDARKRSLNLIHAWVRKAAGEDPEASAAVFLWIDAGPLINAASSLGTLDARVLEARTARKVVVVPDELWIEVAAPHGAAADAIAFVTQYPGMSTDRAPVSRPLLLLRQRSEYGFSDAAELGKFLGTRDRVRVPSSAYLPQAPFDPQIEASDATGPPEDTFRVGVPSGPSRKDETLEVMRLASGRPDPRCDDEDLRETISPPPPSPPPEPRR